MIVLDADSLVEGETIVTMVDRISSDQRIGILQVPPVPVGRSSMFARLQQFAADVYGPIYARGFSTWADGDGNYFGHNAIIRVDAFKRFCHLPVLPGGAPLGGEIAKPHCPNRASEVGSGTLAAGTTSTDNVSIATLVEASGPSTANVTSVPAAIVSPASPESVWKPSDAAPDKTDVPPTSTSKRSLS